MSDRCIDPPSGGDRGGVIRRGWLEGLGDSECWDYRGKFIVDVGGNDMVHLWSIHAAERRACGE